MSVVSSSSISFGITSPSAVFLVAIIVYPSTLILLEPSCKFFVYAFFEPSEYFTVTFNWLILFSTVNLYGPLFEALNPEKSVGLVVIIFTVFPELFVLPLFDVLLLLPELLLVDELLLATFILTLLFTDSSLFAFISVIPPDNEKTYSCPAFPAVNVMLLLADEFPFLFVNPYIVSDFPAPDNCKFHAPAVTFPVTVTVCPGAGFVVLADIEALAALLTISSEKSIPIKNNKIIRYFLVLFILFSYLIM